MTFAGKLIRQLQAIDPGKSTLPEGWHLINPYTDFEQAKEISAQFYGKYLNDNKSRFVLFGINPFKWGAGLTGVPFTDAKRMKENCGIEYKGKASSEQSAAFIYDVIDAYGGPDNFYRDFYFNWLCPLGFLHERKGNNNGYAYYESTELFKSVKELIVKNIASQIKTGAKRDTCFVIGTGKNEKCLHEINDEHHFFKKIIALEHPGYIARYGRTKIPAFRKKYLHALATVLTKQEAIKH
jgi:hypothetical protein